jgi:hypothetical protein
VYSSLVDIHCVSFGFDWISSIWDWLKYLYLKSVVFNFENRSLISFQGAA